MRPIEDEAVDQVLTDVPPMTETSFQAGKQRLLTALDRAPATRPRRMPWLVAAAAGISVLAAGALLAPTGSVEDGDSARAADTLIKAAGVTIQFQPDLVLAPGQYRHVRLRGWWGGPTLGPAPDFYYTAEHVTDTWIPADQRQQWLYRRKSTGNLKVIFGSEQQARADLTIMSRNADGEWMANDGKFFDGKDYPVLPPSLLRPTPAYQAALPKDPKQLYDLLRTEAEQDHQLGETALFLHMLSGLNTGLLTAEVRANVYKAMANLPSLRMTDGIVTLEGRKGVALGVQDDTESRQIIIDPATGEYIGYRNVLIRDYNNIPGGTVLEWESVTTTVVNAMGQTG